MLRAIELTGFKSFADKTRLEFTPGVTAIVGPNGSGKSNVVDAIKWVLGEQSVKSLRGKKMEDVIFDGSSSRSAMGAAEVSLVFDNAKEIFPLETSEVEITRRVYRSGEGEYFINKTACRLKDIRELLYGTGLGAHTYSVIEQGKVDAMLQSSPRERRGIFEEAAGISRFRAKKIEALRKLDRVDQNMLRIRDIVDEVETRLKSVKSQAGKAQRYKKYADRLKELRTETAYSDWLKMSQAIADLESEKEEFLGEKETLEEQTTQLHSQQEEEEAEEKQCAERVRESELATSSNREKIAADETATKHEKRRLTDATHEANRRRKVLRRLKRRADELVEKDAENVTALQDAEQQHTEALENLAQMQEIVTRLNGEMEQAKKIAEQHKAEQMQVMRRSGTLESDMKATNEQVRLIEQAKNDLAGQLESIKEQKEKTEQAVLQKEAELQTAKTRHENAKDNLDNCKKLIAEMSKQVEQENEKLSQLRASRETVSQKIEFLEDFHRRNGGVTSSAREALSLANEDPQGPFGILHGLVGDLIEAKAEIVPYIETALGPYTEYLTAVGAADQQLLTLAENTAELSGRFGVIIDASAAMPEVSAVAALSSHSVETTKPTEPVAAAEPASTPPKPPAHDPFTEMEQVFAKMSGGIHLSETPPSLHSKRQTRTDASSPIPDTLSRSAPEAAPEPDPEPAPAASEPAPEPVRSEPASLAEVPPHSAPSYPDLTGQPGVGSRLDKLVKLDARLNGVVRNLLTRTWVVETLECALRFSRDPQLAGLRFVTPQNQLIETNGTVLFGQPREATGAMSRKTELVTLSLSLDEMLDDINQQEGVVRQLRSRIAERTAELGATEEELRSHQQTCSEYQLEVNSLRKQISSAEKQIVALTDDIQTAVEEIESTKNKIKQLENEREKIQAELQQADATLHQHSADVTELEDQLREQSDKSTDAQILLAKCEERRDSLLADRKRLDKTKQERELALVEERKSQAAEIAKRDEATMTLLNIHSDLAQLYLQKDHSLVETKERIELQHLAYGRMKSVGRKIAKVAKQLRDVEDGIKQLELQLAEQTRERGHLADKLREDYGIELAELNAELSDEKQEEREEIENEIASLRSKIASLGNVNLESLEEIEKIENRFETLSNQYSDLLKAKNATLRIIEKINVDTRRLFQETLEAVRVHFQDLFSHLFGGGRGEIVIDGEEEEECDILEAGIEIIANPPGKDPRSISLLSGGEKTMTCVALLLAIFRSRPSPFCVLDEVDAALDEANNDRFVRVVESFMKVTQFLIVTHSKKTMGCADTIYGVTMQESGVSTPISVRFDQVDEKGDILLDGDQKTANAA